MSHQPVTYCGVVLDHIRNAPAGLSVIDAMLATGYGRAVVCDALQHLCEADRIHLERLNGEFVYKAGPPVARPPTDEEATALATMRAAAERED